MRPKDFIELYYKAEDPRKAKAWHVEREACVKMFYEENIRIGRYTPRGQLLETEVRAMLEAGGGRLLGLPVILTDEPGIRLGCA